MRIFGKAEPVVLLPLPKLRNNFILFQATSKGEKVFKKLVLNLFKFYLSHFRLIWFRDFKFKRIDEKRIGNVLASKRHQVNQILNT